MSDKWGKPCGDDHYEDMLYMVRTMGQARRRTERI